MVRDFCVIHLSKLSQGTFHAEFKPGKDSSTSRLS